ncbi:smr domain-containing protein [Venturia nashicola]|nr:smr domain-containing protein [Venturia nashicola]
MASYAMNELGSRAFNHNSSNDAEQEYDRLRGLARAELAKKQSASSRAHEAYTSGDGARAHELSEESKQHAAKVDQYNKQASDYIFRENNSPDRVPSDTIDLHGQFVEEAEHILETRIRTAQSQGQTHLHVIVGKGNHSPQHIQKIKPRVEEVCRELGLQYQTEHNEGRIYVDLTGKPVGSMPPPPSGYGQHWGGQHGGQPQGQHGGQQHGGQQYGGQHQQQQSHGNQQYGGQHQQQQGNNQNDEMEEVVKKMLPGVLRAIKGCCIVM